MNCSSDAESHNAYPAFICPNQYEDRVEFGVRDATMCANSQIEIMRNQVNVGEQLDHYQIDGLLNHTPFASTFRATDLSTQQTVFLKVPHPDVESDPIFSDRFKREEEIGKLLHHAGLLEILSDGNQSRPYIVMRWFDGQPLRQVLVGTRKLSTERAEKIVLGICDVLDFIENRGIAHRDIRPENVLIDRNDEIKLINFGAASKTGARRITFANLAQSVGMSDYISPEELRGKRGDARSDIYALGVVLYEMLTGRTPFQGMDPFSRLGKDPSPPRDLEPSVSAQLQEVIYRALEEEPRKRYAYAHELAHDLRHLDEVKTTARESQDVKRYRTLRAKKFLVYTALALPPVVIFALLLFFARR
jgi:serine/threonine-protein kinase